MATVDLGIVSAVGEGSTRSVLRLIYGWTVKQVMPAGRMMGALVSDGTYLYYLGGQTTTTDSAAVTTVYKYDPVLNTWTTVTALNTARTKAYLMVYAGSAYLMGGQNATGSLQAGVMYDLATGTQTTRDSLDFLSGGWYGHWVYNDHIFIPLDPWFYEYNPATNNWTFVSGNEDGTSGAAAVLGPDGKAHVFGGQGELTTHRVYNHATDTWAAGTAIPSPGVTLSPGCVVKSGLIYLIGGRNVSADIATVRIFDTVLNTWTLGADLPAARGYIGNGACALGGVIYVAGGSLSGTAQTSLYALSTSEIDMGVCRAIGQGHTTGGAVMTGSAIGQGVTEGEIEVQFTGQRMYGGLMPISGQGLIDYWTDRSPVR